MAGRLHGLWRTFNALLFGKSHNQARTMVALAQALHRRGSSFLARQIIRRVERKFGVYVALDATLHETVRFRHPTGVVIGSGVTVGRGVTIYQNVTLGGARLGDFGRRLYPTIGDGTVIFAGAKIVGMVAVGRNCVIGANAVVTRDVPDGCVAVGVPARILPRKDAGQPVDAEA